MLYTKNLKFQNFITYQDLVVKEGFVNFINGPSGTGKSTLLKLFNRTANPSCGEIYYKDRLITDYETISLRKEVKLISQTSFLFPGTILENFEIFYRYCECKLNLNPERLKYFLELAAMNLKLESDCGTLSGGEKQRVYIAICLSMESEVIMLDEPSSALDKRLADRLLKNIIGYVKDNDKTLIVISHDEELVAKYSENLITLQELKR